MLFEHQLHSKNDILELRYIDLFCGIGGFRVALNLACSDYKIKKKTIKPICVFSSDLDKQAQITYQANFQEYPQGDITKIPAESIPNHNLLLAGFPCQPFSICGKLQGFEDTRGTLFFEIARILNYHKPYAFILENVKQLVGHNKGKTLKMILDILLNLGYYTDYKVLNALNFGLPQKRERVFIVGFREPLSFNWPQPNRLMKPLSEILEKSVSKFYYASPEILKILDYFNKNNPGVVERYIYYKFQEKLGIISSVINLIVSGVSDPKNFKLETLLSKFREETKIKRSIDKCYEIITYSLFETVVNQLEAEITVEVPKKNLQLLQEFSDLSQVLLNVSPEKSKWTELAHIYRVGVTNAADKGLDMWANFRPVIQVKHLTLNAAQVETIVDQIESDHIIIVCRDADASVISVLMKQIGWGKRVRSIVKESQLLEWYHRCLEGQFSHQLAQPLMTLLQQGFDEEFPEVKGIREFCQERQYTEIDPPPMWQ
ncbi:HaeII family restriction endonuclease [Crocosphaera sp.]|uniref:HaeII family restriction endonuclease n=1 Tax=Crocosphaera sp. TaxID=2729996 RepID=UPI003F1F5DFF|nr:HaeII family restriction endonuclease [Crocosphaera sp.]